MRWCGAWDVAASRKALDGLHAHAVVSYYQYLWLRLRL
jgi:hypothetical protein